MSQVQNVKQYCKIIVGFCPILAIIFTLMVITLTVYINEKVTPLFMFFCVQVYLNWYSLYSISHNATTVRIRDTGNMLIYGKMTSAIQKRHNENYKFWYCEKCQSYTCKPTQHCTFCGKCYHFRDHHCFFLGACVLRQNMGNFILFCLYTTFTCAYSLWTLGPYLYETINRTIQADTGPFNIILNFCFPIALVKLIYLGKNTCVFLVIMFDMLVSILCIASVYGIWKLHSCIAGKQKYANITGKQNIKEIFGSYGLSNIIFPYNGLIGTRDINGKYELKEV